MSNIFNPCYDYCYIRLNKQYTEDCDKKCDFAKAIEENKILRAEGEWIYICWCVFKCSKCGNRRDKHEGKDLTPYCDMCGAKMKNYNNVKETIIF